jgi:hypothetical protein
MLLLLILVHYQQQAPRLRHLHTDVLPLVVLRACSTPATLYCVSLFVFNNYPNSTMSTVTRLSKWVCRPRAPRCWPTCCSGRSCYSKLSKTPRRVVGIFFATATPHMMPSKQKKQRHARMSEDARYCSRFDRMNTCCTDGFAERINERERGGS